MFTTFVYFGKKALCLLFHLFIRCCFMRIIQKNKQNVIMKLKLKGFEIYDSWRNLIFFFKNASWG